MADGNDSGMDDEKVPVKVGSSFIFNHKIKGLLLFHYPCCILVIRLHSNTNFLIGSSGEWHIFPSQLLSDEFNCYKANSVLFVLQIL